MNSTADYLNKQIKDQAERANEVQRENQKLGQELKFLESEATTKRTQVQKLNDQNAQIKARNYDKEIEELTRKFNDQQRKREQFLCQIQHCHN